MIALVQAVDTYSIEVEIKNPTNTTYTNPLIPVNITTVTNGSNPITVWNIQFPNGTLLYAENQTFTVATYVTLNENVSATLTVWANNTELAVNSSSVSFTVLLEEEPEPTPATSSMDLLMFIFPFVFALIFSILALLSRSKQAKLDSPVNWAGLFYAALAMILWWVYGILWPAVAVSAVYVPFAWLWFAVGFIFFAIFFAYVFLAVKAEIEARRPGGLVIKERNTEDY
jgi:hypothetical protein